MSCKGILPQTRNGSGQIEDECKKELEDSLDFCNDGEYSTASPCAILPHNNQDVAEDGDNGENTAASVLEIAASTNFILPSVEMTSDVVGTNVDDWFKPRTDGSMDLDSVLTTDGIEVNDLEGYHFAAAKDNGDMCIVANICDMGLGFDIPVSICDKNNQRMSESDCDERVVNGFEQPSFLDDFSKNDIDKGMLIKVNSPKLSEKCDLLSVKSKEVTDNFIVQSQDKVVKDNDLKHGVWNQNEDVYAQLPVILSSDKVNWEALSTISQQSTDYESEKDVDFSEFSLLTFQVDNADGINVINTLSQIDGVCDNGVVPGNLIVSDSCVISDTISLTDSCNVEQEVVSTIKPRILGSSKRASKKDKGGTEIASEGNILNIQTDSCVVVESLPASKVESKINGTNILSKAVATTQTSLLHPRSLLRPSQKIMTPKPMIEPDTLIKKVSETCNIVPTTVNCEQENSTRQGSSKKAPAMTIIAISTDKSKNTTEIVINTSQGEQKFKGKTSDFIKATSKLFSSQSVKAKIGQSLNLSNVELSREDSAASQAESDGDWTRYDKSKLADEQPITEALATLGIDMSSVTSVTTEESNGTRLWACPTPDCNKLYPRLSLLKVHILTHYGVRPYRCDVPGCHWTFYTYFKLKRHKETHLKRKAFVCPVPSCGHRLTTIYNLKTHRKLHERPAKLQCPVVGCDAHFQTKRAVELHVKKHGISHAPYQCTHAGCGKRYYSNNTLNSHARSHQHREDEIRCQWPDCGKWFDKPCRLKAHMRTHTGDKPYLCSFQNCGWAFSSASKLKRHQQKHTNERKFRCSFEGCGKSFMRSEHLKEHMQTHIGERSYQCTVENCGVKFTAKSSLYVHLKKHKQQMKEAGSTADSQAVLHIQPADSAPFQNQHHAVTSLVVPKWEAGQQAGRVQVVMPVASSAFHCPVESCPKSYSCKASLRQHLLKHHTPVLASDASQLDYVTSLLLSGGSNQQVLVSTSEEQPVVTSDGLTAVSLQGPVCTVAVAGVGDLNSSGLLTTNALFDPATTFSPEYINTDLLSTPHINNMLVVTQPGAVVEGGPGAGTTVLLTSESAAQGAVPDPDTELHLATESITDPLLLDEFEQSQVVAFNLNHVDSEEERVPDDPTCHAARTHLTYQEVVQRKQLQNCDTGSVVTTARKIKSDSPGRNGNDAIVNDCMETNGSGTVAAGTIAGLRDPVTALRLPPDMAGLLAPTSDLNLLLQEDSGLQVLLLDGTESQSYAESTINLRDLE